MAGGGQTRPMGGAMPMAAIGGIDPINRRGGNHIANLAEGRPAFAPRPLKASAGELLSANSGRIPGVDFPRRGEEGDFYNQAPAGAGARIPQDMGGIKTQANFNPMMMDSQSRPPFGRPQAPSPLAPQGNFNVNQAAAGGLQQAFQGTQQAMQAPNIGQFMNPYTRQVTQNTLADLERQRQMQMNTLGAQASGARAFGGSRHGVAEALTNEGFARQGAQAFGNLQQQGFNTALQAAQAQQGRQMAGAAQLGQLGQQAFGTGQAIQQQQAQQGLLQQGLQQSLIDAAKQQYAGYTGAPAAALNAPLAALGVAQRGGASETVKSQDPGLLTYLQLGLGMMP